MSQSRLASFVEASANLAIGFVISIAIGRFLYPLFGYQVTLADNAGLTAIFTAASITRSYFTRRFFNWLHTRKVSTDEE